MITNKEHILSCLEAEIWGNKNPMIKHRTISTFLKARGKGSLNALYLIRIGQYFFHCHSGFLRKIVCKFLRNRLITQYGIYLNWETYIGKGLELPHPNGIVIGKTSVIGENCRILQQVTIGSARKGDYLLNKQPHLGNNILLGAGSKILGSITLKDNTVVGANAVLLTDTVESGVYVGVPARIVK